MDAQKRMLLKTLQTTWPNSKTLSRVFKMFTDRQNGRIGRLKILKSAMLSRFIESFEEFRFGRKM